MAKEEYTMPKTSVKGKDVPPEFSSKGLAAYTQGGADEVGAKPFDVEKAALRATKVLGGDVVGCYKQ